MNIASSFHYHASRPTYGPLFCLVIAFTLVAGVIGCGWAAERAYAKWQSCDTPASHAAPSIEEIVQ